MLHSIHAIHFSNKIQHIFMALDTDDIHVQRGLFFPWKKGVSERLVISDLEEFSKSKKRYPSNYENLTLNFNKVTSLAIAGNSGSGKSYALTYFLSLLKHFSELSSLTLSLIPRLAGLVKMVLPLFIHKRTVKVRFLYSENQWESQQLPKSHPATSRNPLR